MSEGLILREVAQNINTVLPLTLMVIALITALVVFVSRNSCHKYLNQLLMENEIEHSLRLIEVLHSERHEYQNYLQVIKSLTALGKTERMERYLSSIIAQMRNSSGFMQVENPVLAASIVTHQTKAKEYGINVRVNCMTPLKDLSDISVSLGEIIDSFFEVMIGNMSSLKGSGNEILLNILERTDEYIFDFKTDYSSDVPAISVFSAFCDKFSFQFNEDKYAKRIAELKKKIKKIKGGFYYVIKDHHIIRLKLTVNRQKKEGRVFPGKKVISF
jgi:sensor histidine kinase regulating citrate/malate metabolism